MFGVVLEVDAFVQVHDLHQVADRSLGILLVLDSLNTPSEALPRIRNIDTASVHFIDLTLSLHVQLLYLTVAYCFVDLLLVRL